MVGFIIKKNIGIPIFFHLYSCLSCFIFTTMNNILSIKFNIVIIITTTINPICETNIDKLLPNIVATPETDAMLLS